MPYLANHFEKNLAISKELSAWCIKHISELADKELEEGANRLKSHTERRKALEVKLGRLLDIRLSRDQISHEDTDMLNRKEVELKTELESLRSTNGSRSSEWLPEVIEQFDLATEVVEIFKNGQLPEKKGALATLGSNLTLNTGKVTVVCAETVEALMKGLITVRFDFPEFEPKNIIDTSSSNPDFAPMSGHMLRRQDSNLRPMRYTESILVVMAWTISSPFLRVGCEALPVLIEIWIVLLADSL